MAESRQRIVVGVDGSGHSRRAFEWALAEGRLRGAPIEAVHVWHFPYGVAAPAPVAVHAQLRAELRHDAQALLESAVQDVAVDEGNVTCVLREGSASGELIEASRGAAMLVLGSRGRGGFASLLLGSVGQQCAHHAHCPLVIVPPPR